MDGQRCLNVEMRVMFNVSVDEDFDIDKFSEEDLKEIAHDYFFDGGGIYNADYLDFEFSLD